MKTVHNERMKLSATFLNGLAIALLAIGGLTPAVQVMGSATHPVGEWTRAKGMSMETAALLFAPVSALLVGLFVYVIATRKAKRDLPPEADKPAEQRA